MRGILSAGLFFSLSLIPPLVVNGQTPSTLPASPSATATHPLDNPNAKEAYVFELLQRKVRFEADGRGQRDLTVRARIQSESAVREFGLLAYPFASSFESLDVLYVRVRKPDGTVVETPASDVQELDSAVSREAPMYTDQREKHIAVKSLSVGDLLEANLRWTIHDPIAPGHFWYDDSYFRAGICLKETIEINVPRNLSVKLRNSGPQPSIREEGDRRIYAFQTSNLKEPEESKIPAWEKDYHGVEPPDIQLSSFSSWEDVGSWFASLVQPKLALTPEIRAKAEELTKGKTSDDEKLHALYDFVSTRFRYIGVGLGLGRYTPHTAGEVLTNRYGDCKDKHTLFAALLQAVGIPAYPVLISSKYRLDPSVSSPSLFDHVITAIPRGDSFLLLDTTPEVAPFGLLMRNIRDRQALVMPGTGPGRLVTTPAEPPFLSHGRVRVDSSIDAHGTLDAKMRIEDRGDYEVALRLTYRSTPQNRWQELTQNLAAGMGFAGTVSDVSVAQPEDTSQPFWISFSYHRTDFPDWKAHRILLPAPPFLLRELTEEQKLSKDPLPLGSPQDVTYDTTVRLPKGFTPLVPEKVERKTDFAEFSATYSLEKDVLHGTLHLKTLLREIPGTKRSEFSSLSKTVDETQRRYIFISGDFPAATSSFDPRLFGLVPSNPEDVIPQLEKTLAADPDNDAILLRLSQVYCDAGRPADAVAILQKAMAGHPDVPSHLLLALGLTYLRVPDADKAMVEFKKALGNEPEPDQLNTVAYALAEANVHLGQALDYSARAVSSLSSQTMDISPDSPQPSEYKLIVQLAANWDTLGWIKFRMGDYSGAGKYLESAWQLMQTSTIGEHLVEVYEKLGKKQKAATVCNMALAAGAVPDLHQKLSEEMTRLRPFLKAPTGPGTIVTRSGVPDGSMALSDMRTINIPFRTKLQGSPRMATFAISLTNGPRVDNVVFLSGAEELRKAITALAATKYPQPFPDDTPTRILRKATFSCSIYTKDCILVLMPVQDAAVPASPNIKFNSRTHQ